MQVYVVKAPNEYSLDNVYFQDEKLRFKGDLTARRTLVEYVRDDTFASDQLEAAQNVLSNGGWTEKEISKLLMSHTVSVSWQVPVRCELDKINDADGNGDESDGEDLFAEANAREAITNEIKKSMTPKKQGTK